MASNVPREPDHRDASAKTIGGSLDAYEPLVGAEDKRLPLVSEAGVDLLTAMKHLPDLADFLRSYGISQPIVRAKVSAETRDSESILTINFHPGHPGTINRLFDRILIRPCDFENIDWHQQSNHGTLVQKTSPTNPSELQLPCCTTLKADELRFWSEPVSLNEFGFYYVALFIAGNYARYFPDRWLKDIELASPLAIAIEQLVESAKTRLPLLCLSELSGDFQLIV
ncbi:MAG: hypothetical protein Q7T86_15710 [Hyphomicrobiaceae bacterium]|nr:hypothetical protein [Hyphomicrobiaceae bacterium]